MQWWTTFLNRKLSERLVWAFITCCLSLATGLMIGTLISGFPAPRRTPESSASTMPVPDSEAGVGGQPRASPSPRRTTRYNTWPTRSRTPAKPTRKPTHRPSPHHTPTVHPTPTPHTESPPPTTEPPPTDQTSPGSTVVKSSFQQPRSDPDIPSQPTPSD